MFVANALSPAQVVGVDIDEQNRIASVTVPERMLSLAIGREGQNARLAAKLTGWRIDIRSDVSVAEAQAAAGERGRAPQRPPRQRRSRTAVATRPARSRRAAKKCAASPRGRRAAEPPRRRADAAAEAAAGAGEEAAAPSRRSQPAEAEAVGAESMR